MFFCSFIAVGGYIGRFLEAFSNLRCFGDFMALQNVVSLFLGCCMSLDQTSWLNLWMDIKNFREVKFSDMQICHRQAFLMIFSRNYNMVLNTILCIYFDFWIRCDFRWLFPIIIAMILLNHCLDVTFSYFKNKWDKIGKIIHTIMV